MVGFRSRAALWLSLFHCAVAQAVPPGQSALLNGMHDTESGSWLASATPGCDKGWMTDLQYVGLSGTPAPNCHDADVAAGVSIIQRLDVDGAQSYAVNPADAPKFASTFSSFVSQCPNIHVWIVGNEPNFSVNNSDPATFASQYAESYAQVHAKVHALAGHQNDLVLAGPASPYSPFCICSLVRIIEEIRKRGVEPDGFALHAYTQAQTSADFGQLVGLVSTDAMSGSNDGCGYPFHWHFRIYRDYIAQLEKLGLTGTPVYITETGNACQPQQGNKCYPDNNVGYFQAMWKEIDDWNNDPATQTKVRALTPYRWTLNDDGTGRDFEIGSRAGLKDDLVQAFGHKYAWTAPACPGTCGHDTDCAGKKVCDIVSSHACTATTGCGAQGACGANEVCRQPTADCVPVSRGSATLAVSPPSPAQGASFTVDVSSATARTNGAVSVVPVAGGAPLALVPGGGNTATHLSFSSTAGAQGTYRVTFSADPQGTVYAIGYFNVGPPAGVVDSGAPDAGAPDAGEPDAGQSSPSPAPGDAIGACGCSGSPLAPLLAGLAALLGAARRRAGPLRGRQVGQRVKPGEDEQLEHGRS